MKGWLKRLLWGSDPEKAAREARLERAYRAARYMSPGVAAQITSIYEADKRRRKEERRKAREARRNSKG